MTNDADPVHDSDLAEGNRKAAADLYWIPLGAGAHVVRISGKLFEAASASLPVVPGVISTILRSSSLRQKVTS